MCEAGDAELVRCAGQPPAELDFRGCVELNDFRCARIGGGDEERKVGASVGREEGAVHLGADVRGTVGVDCCDLVDFDVRFEQIGGWRVVGAYHFACCQDGQELPSRLQPSEARRPLR